VNGFDLVGHLQGSILDIAADRRSHDTPLDERFTQQQLSISRACSSFLLPV
jgi:hypothetical protein